MTIATGATIVGMLTKYRMITNPMERVMFIHQAHRATCTRAVPKRAMPKIAMSSIAEGNLIYMSSILLLFIHL